MGCGERSEAEFTGFLQAVVGLLAENTLDGSIHQICMDWRHMWEMLEAGRRVYSELKNLCIWNKTNAGMGSFYRSKHELVFVWKSGTAAHINNFELGQHGRHRTNVWDYAGVNTMRAGAWKSWRCIPPSSRSPWSRTRSRTARAAAGWCSIPSAVAAPS